LNEGQKYVAVKIDLRSSRRISDRAEAQERLFATMRALNEEFADAVQSRFIVTHGDEAQGLLRADMASSVVRVMERAVDGMRPQMLRFGIGLGTLATPIQPDAIGMDGEAWYRASEKIADAARERKFVLFSGFGEEADNQSSAMANLLLYLRYRWTDDQQRVIELVEACPTQAVAAERLGISQAAVSKSLRISGWRYYSDGQDALVRILNSASGASGDRSF